MYHIAEHEIENEILVSEMNRDIYKSSEPWEIEQRHCPQMARVAQVLKSTPN